MSINNRHKNINMSSIISFWVRSINFCVFLYISFFLLSFRISCCVRSLFNRINRIFKIKIYDVKKFEDKTESNKYLQIAFDLKVERSVYYYYYDDMELCGYLSLYWSLSILFSFQVNRENLLHCPLILHLLTQRSSQKQPSRFIISITGEYCALEPLILMFSGIYALFKMHFCFRSMR